VPLAASADFGTVWRFAHGGALLVKRHPDLPTQEFIKADLRERIFVDTRHNGPGSTCAAVYAVRPKEGAPVTAPSSLGRDGSGAVGPHTFTNATMPPLTEPAARVAPRRQLAA
jgi:DNA primase